MQSVMDRQQEAAWAFSQFGQEMGSLADANAAPIVITAVASLVFLRLPWFLKLFIVSPLIFWAVSNTFQGDSHTDKDTHAEQVSENIRDSSRPASEIINFVMLEFSAYQNKQENQNAGLRTQKLDASKKPGAKRFPEGFQRQPNNALEMVGV